MKRILAVFILLQTAVGVCAQSDDMLAVKKHICASYGWILNGEARLKRQIATIGKYSGNPDIMVRELKEGIDWKRVKQYFSTLNGEGYWSDLDYEDNSRSGWQPSFHAERLALLAKAYRNTDSRLYGNARLGTAIHRAMAYWFKGDFKCRNWWYNQIGVPKMLGTVFLLMEEELTAEEETEAIEYMKNARLGMTGQNSVWLAENVLVRALLEKNEGLFREARNAILKQLKVNRNGEGIRPDMSFHQHGAQLQFGNYGLAFANTMAYWARIFSGTAYALSPAQIEVLRDYLLEGMQWIVWKGNMDIGSCGRQLFPYAQQGKALSLGRAIQNMSVADTAYAEEYARWYARDIVGSKRRNDFTGHIYFPYSDYGVHRSSEWCATLKMSSNRVIGSEIVNAENLCGRYLGDGALYVYKTGEEYRDIFPVWDWTRLPGVTCCEDPGVFGKGSVFRNVSDFVGGLSDGKMGVAAMVLEKDGVSARKSYFFTTDAIICMGDGISCDRPFAVTTTVEQCLKKGKIRTWRQKNGATAYYHRGTAYVFPGEQQLLYAAGKQTGNWHKVAMFADTARVKKKVFRLGLGHGKNPENASYRYAIVPVVKTRNWKKCVRELPVSYRTEGGNIHAIRQGEDWQIVFFEPGPVTWETGRKRVFYGEQPGIVMLKKTGEGWQLLACDPTGQKEKLTFRFSGRWTGAACAYNEEKQETTVEVPLSGGYGQIAVGQAFENKPE